MKPSLFRNEKVAVTGGTGFIGVPLVNQLRNVGATVRTISNLENSRKIEKEFKGCKYVFHLAATFSPSGAGQKDENFLMTKNVLQASLRGGVSKVLMASSSAVYPEIPSIIPIPESSGREGIPNGAYGQSKRNCEDLSLQYMRKYNVCVVIPRIFNVYGPGDYSKRFIPTVIKKAISNRNIYVNSRGNQTRDFIYIDDCVRGLIKCMGRGESGQILNICTGKEINIADAVNMIIKQTNSKSKVEVKPKREERDRKSVGDTALARKYIGFQAKVSFEEGINKTIEWFRQNESNE